MKERNEKKKVALKILENKVARRIIILFLLGLLAGILIRIFWYNDEAKITSTYLGAKLSKASELTTAKLEYNGFLLYEYEGIPIINKGNFIMTYEATVRLGIDLKKVEPKVDEGNKVIYLTIPKAEIQDVKIGSEPKYYDESFTLLNVDEKEDVDKARKLAEEDAFQEVSKMGVLEYADKQAETFLKGFLQDAVPNKYVIKVKRKE